MLNFGKRLGIDLGTANSLVYLVGQGVVLNEPTVVAVTVEDSAVVAVGNEAKQMLGRTPGNIMASRPMRDGVIADYEATEAMLRYFIDRVCGSSRLFKPEVMICVPAGVTQVERRAVLDATLSAGARVAYLIDEPLAAAIGAKIPIANPSGNMIVDIGGGSTEAAVISLGGVVAHRSARVAGNRVDEAIIHYVKRRYNLLIGERTAEEIKITIGSAILVGKKDSSQLTVHSSQKDSSSSVNREQSSPVNQMEVRGRDAASGLPRVINLTADEVVEAITPVLSQIITAVKGVLEETPPELASDIIDRGIVLSGGTSLLRNLDKLMTETISVPVHVADDPLFCVVKGCGIAMENIDLYKKSVNRK
ncbi:MAG: Rod shape-determining protein MreB [Microgenomates group bacterium GW2011_GWA1_48_10]|uniref:Cell shape-determining protein MreB n=1 Tax=Candidatus Gottesmanbacteria bacterium RIFCSPHIGHO2_01_FULL_47_48 TaxID=1798381 RepID=A0A1F6A3T2_9BACT|nr:MAG: Rod shape-determining protein MreB [Microgenomates group bacterium GW2011_GWA1_48_10]OGG19373.1 MAG: rod shape-determining protein [Candidatus Gottesmanbacteria bacterium RIFCSPHIGHO2_01_FULL_47_48]